MKCLVTGGAGFIGSHLCERLLMDGHDVVALDNLLTGSTKNLTSFIHNPHFLFIQHDVIQPFPETIGKCEALFHFASPASPPKYQKYQIETLRVNTQGTYVLLEKAVADKAMFIYASTSEVYGDPLEHPQKETYWGNVNPNGKRSCYDEGKRAGEAFVAAYARTRSLDTRIIRIFNTYGPRMDIDDGRVVTNFIKQALRSEQLTLYGDGNQTRSYCYISDLVEGIVKVFQEPKMKNEIVNLGNTEEKTVEELAHLICTLTRTHSTLVHGELPEDDPSRRRPDLTKAETLLGWEPRISLEEGLTMTINHFKEQ